MKKLLILSCILAIVLSLSGCNVKRNASGGDLVIYTPESDLEISAIVPAFEEKYSVSVRVVYGSTGECLNLIQGETSEHIGDIMWGGIDYSTYQQYPGLWERYISSNDSSIENEQYRNTTGYYTNFGLSGDTVFVINTAKLAEAGLALDDVRGYQDLVDHITVLTGKIYMGDPNATLCGWAQLKSMLYLFSEGKDAAYDARDYEKSWAFVKSYAEMMKNSVLASSYAVLKGVTEGNCIVAITTEAPALALLKGGAANVAVIYPKEGSSWTPRGAAIIKNAPHMDNAKLFIDFLISEEGQKLLAETTMRPIITSIANTSEFIKPLEEIANVFTEDYEYTAAHKDEWLAGWNEIIGK